MNRIIPALLLASIATAAPALTLTEDRGGFNAPHTVTFTRIGELGTGRMATADQPRLVTGPDGTAPWLGRFNPYDDAGSWWSSEDSNAIRMDVTFAEPTDRLMFAVSDMADIPRFADGGSFRIKEAGGAPLFEIAGRQPNGNARFFTLVFDEARTDASIAFRTLRNDGFGVSIAPVPLPAAAWLLFGGVAAMFGLRWRKRSANA